MRGTHKAAMACDEDFGGFFHEIVLFLQNLWRGEKPLNCLERNVPNLFARISDFPGQSLKEFVLLLSESAANPPHLRRKMH